jgi:hypothetical protein
LAFDEWLDGVLPEIPVLWRTHDDDAPRLTNKVASLFADDIGLGFSAVAQ